MIKNDPNTPRRLAILGHHGIPSNYGGFETFAEQAAIGLVQRGLSVVGYCRSNYFRERPKDYRGVKLVYIPTIINKYLDTFIHTWLSILRLLIFNTADVALIVNVGNAPFVGLARLFGKKTIFCVDGLDWERKKWGWFARWYLKLCSKLVPYVANEIVTDAISVQEFYKTQRGTDSVFIPYGTDIVSHPANPDLLQTNKLQPKGYFIYVARFEPENNPLEVVKAYVAAQSPYPLVMIGDNRYNREFVAKVKAAGNNQVLFLGYVFGERYKELVSGSLAYIRAAEVGGSSPATIEAMGRGTCVIGNDKPENREVLGETGLYYSIKDFSTLTTIIRAISARPEIAIARGAASLERAKSIYRWDRIVDDYVALINQLAEPGWSTTQIPASYRERAAERTY